MSSIQPNNSSIVYLSEEVGIVVCTDIVITLVALPILYATTVDPQLQGPLSLTIGLCAGSLFQQSFPPFRSKGHLLLPSVGVSLFVGLVATGIIKIDELSGQFQRRLYFTEIINLSGLLFQAVGVFVTLWHNIVSPPNRNDNSPGSTSERLNEDHFASRQHVQSYQSLNKMVINSFKIAGRHVNDILTFVMEHNQIDMTIMLRKKYKKLLEDNGHRGSSRNDAGGSSVLPTIANKDVPSSGEVSTNSSAVLQSSDFVLKHKYLCLFIKTGKHKRPPKRLMAQIGKQIDLPTLVRYHQVTKWRNFTTKPEMGSITLIGGKKVPVIENAFDVLRVAIRCSAFKAPSLRPSISVFRWYKLHYSGEIALKTVELILKTDGKQGVAPSLKLYIEQWIVLTLKIKERLKSLSDSFLLKTG